MSNEQLYNMKELSNTPYFGKNLCNMVVLKALSPNKLHFSYCFCHFWLFWLKITFGTFLKNRLMDPFEQLYCLDETAENK